MSEVRPSAYWTGDQGIAVIHINNPPMHVLSRQVKGDLAQCVSEIEGHDEIRVVVITSSGDTAFMAGGDIKEFPSLMEPGQAWANSNLAHQVNDRLAALSKPTIAAINGMALGGGFELVLSCDFRIAAEHARFGLPEIKLGLFPGAGGTQRLTRLVGTAKAKEIMFLGEPISAQEAHALGIVNQVVPKGKALDYAFEWAGKLKERPGQALAMLKQLIDEADDLALQEGLRMEKEYHENVFRTEDVREGISAFMEKRRPEFKHR